MCCSGRSGRSWYNRARGWPRARASSRGAAIRPPRTSPKRGQPSGNWCMPKLSNPLIDRHSPDRRPRRAAYALPTLFTAGNIFLGYLSILRSFRGAMLAAAAGAGSAGAAEDFEIAAKAIGIAVLLDGLDGMIARLTHTTSDFGREMDSLADV